MTTDRGVQFESKLFKTLIELIGTDRIRTTAYHPQANCMVVRVHRQLKAALRAYGDSSKWFDVLPLVLLGIHAAVKEDIGCSAAEVVFGTQFRLPGQLICPSES